VAHHRRLEERQPQSRQSSGGGLVVRHFRLQCDHPDHLCLRGVMVADFKSHVLSRDEKGLFGIPFKRLLLAGVGGGLTYTLFNLGLPQFSIPLGLVMGIALIRLTGTQGGLPLWQRSLYAVRGKILLASVQNPTGFSRQLARWIDLPTELVRLNSQTIFTAPHTSEIDLREWVTFAHAQEEEGLVFVDAPMKEVHP
jgi:hypothetical protein